MLCSNEIISWTLSTTIQCLTLKSNILKWNKYLFLSVQSQIFFDVLYKFLANFFHMFNKNLFIQNFILRSQWDFFNFLSYVIGIFYINFKKQPISLSSGLVNQSSRQTFLLNLISSNGNACDIEWPYKLSASIYTICFFVFIWFHLSITLYWAYTTT